GWANPHADAERQMDFLTAPEFLAEFYLTQVGRHHHLEQVKRVSTHATRTSKRPTGSSWPPAAAAFGCRQSSACSFTGARIRGHWRHWAGSCRCPPKGSRASSRRARPPKRSAHGPSGRCSTSGPGTSISATC